MRRVRRDVFDTDIYFTVPDFKSSKLRVYATRRAYMYQWTDLSVFVPKVDEGLSLRFYFGDDLLWVDETISAATLKLASDSPRRRKLSLKRPEKQSTWVPLEKGDGKAFVEYQGYIDGILISKVFLSVPNLPEQLANIHHKVTCLVSGETFDEYAYLGRAQSIATNHQALTRVYIWKAKAEESFPGVSLHRGSGDCDNDNNLVEHLSDINKMQLNLESTSDIHALLSARHLKPMHKSHEYEMDHDSFSNAYRVLPVKLKGQKTVLIRFYNFKFNPPRCTEIRIPRSEFVTSTNVMTKKMEEIDGVITIVHKDAMYIESIMLTVRDYANNLDFIRDIVPQTR